MVVLCAMAVPSAVWVVRRFSRIQHCSPMATVAYTLPSWSVAEAACGQGDVDITGAVGNAKPAPSKASSHSSNQPLSSAHPSTIIRLHVPFSGHPTRLEKEPSGWKTLVMSATLVESMTV